VGAVAGSPPWAEGWDEEEEDEDPSEVVPDSPAGAPSAPDVEGEDDSVAAGEVSFGVDEAGASEPLDALDPSGDSVGWVAPAEDSVGWVVPAEDSFPAGADDSGVLGEAASEPLPAGASSEVAVEGSVEVASWALATPAGSITSHTRAARSPAQSHALERLCLEELAFIPITTASP
jgi:hypothetical protein